MTAFLEVKCFKEASYILSSFKYLFSGISDLEELFSDMLSSYGKQIIDHEPNPSKMVTCGCLLNQESLILNTQSFLLMNILQLGLILPIIVLIQNV